MDSFLVDNTFYIANFQDLKCYNFRSGENLRLAQEAMVPKIEKENEKF